MSERKIGLSFGALSPPIRDQLKVLGINPLPTETQMTLWEKLSYSITLLAIQGFISDSVKEKCYQKLMKMIMKELNK